MARGAGDASFSLGSFEPSFVSVLPEALLRDGEVQAVTAAASTQSSRRSERRLMRAGAAFATELPILPAAPVFAVGSATPYLRPSITIPRLFADDFLLIEFSQASAAMRGQVSLTQGYLGGVGKYTLPDLSAIAGFDASWALASGVATDWQRYSQQSAAGVTELLAPSRPELEGAIYRGTTLTGQHTF